MAKLFGRSWTRKELVERIGDVSQLATVRRHTLTDGKAKGVAAIEVSTGDGFRFTVLPDRALDISQAEHNGRSLCWRSPTGDVSPYFYQPEGLEWLYGFCGGLLCTCGLTHFGAPCEDEGKQLGLHGRISSIPAADVSVAKGWEGDEYVITIQGEVSECSVFGPCLTLSRRICAFLGQKRLFIHDEVTNAGHDPAPHMLLYHINVGFPVVDAGSRLIAPSRKVTPRDKEAARHAADYAHFTAPQAGFKEQVFYHDLAAAKDQTMAAVVNPRLGFGTYAAWDKSRLPQFIEWKQLGKGNYVVGIEPATNLVGGRDKERAAGRLRMLKPGETASYDLELGALTSNDEIGDFEKMAAKTLGSKRPRTA